MENFTSYLLWFCLGCLFLATLYIVSIAWLSATHIFSILSNTQKLLWTVVKSWIRLLLFKLKWIRSSSMELELNELEIPSELSTESETAPQQSTKRKFDQPRLSNGRFAKKSKKSKSEKE